MKKKLRLVKMLNFSRRLIIVALLLVSVKAVAQNIGSASFGNVYVHHNGSMTIFGNHIFKPGIIGTERDTPMGFVNFAKTATYTGAADNQMIDGYVKSYRLDSFIFPIGDNSKYRPAMISKSDTLKPNNAAYYGVNPDIAITSKPFSTSNFPILPVTGPFPISALGEKISSIDSKEYWDINGETSTKISLSWDANSDVTNLVKGSLDKLTIVGWDGAKWVRIPSTVDATSFMGTASSLTTGSIKTDAELTPNTYEVYTLGFECDTPFGTPVLTCNVPKCDTICKTENPTVIFTVSGYTDAVGYIWTTSNGIVLLSSQDSTATFDISGAAGNSTISVQAYSLCDTGSACAKSMFVFECPKVEIEDTTITTNPGSTVVIGPEVVPGPGATVVATVNGPINGSGTATIDPKTGVVTFVPSDTPFVGKDTIQRIVCLIFADGTPKKCDTSYIYINNPPINNVEVASTPAGVPVPFPSLPVVIFEGNPLEPVVDPTLTINANGTVTYTPPPGFVGIDTAVIKRCDDRGNCITTTYIVAVGPELPNDTAQINQDTKHVFTNPVNIENGIPTITAQSPANGTSSVDADGNITYIPNAGFSGLDSFVRILCVEYANGVVLCDTAMCYIIVNKVVVPEDVTVIPNYISPNGDGVNDEFDLSLLQKDYPNLKLSIYNRWGNIVYRSVGPYQNDWDGYHGVNGEKLPDATYYYIIELSPNFDNVKTGFVEIMRQ